VIASPLDGSRESVTGCYPRFTPEGTLLARPALAFASELWEDGAVALTAADLMRGFPPDSTGTIRLLGYDRSVDGVLAVTAVGTPSDGPGLTVLELWDGGELTASVRLPGRSGANGSRFGELLRFSPDGTQFAVGPLGGREGGPVSFVDLRLRRPTFELPSQRGFSWSPDGAWLAVAVGEEIAIYSRESSEIVYRLAVPAWSVNWVREPGA
jgi:WD40 repeat protein